MPQSTTHPDRFVDDRATADERTYCTFTHLVGLLSLTSSGIPLIGLIATLIMWQVKKSQSPFLDDHGREAMNFQISLVLWVFVGLLGALIFAISTLFLGVMLLPFLGGAGLLFLNVLQVVGSIRGAMAANRGEYYRYPMTIRVLPDKTVV